MVDAADRFASRDRGVYSDRSRTRPRATIYLPVAGPVGEKALSVDPGYHAHNRMTWTRSNVPELLGALSVVADVGVGVPRETGIGAAVIAGRISRRLGLSAEEEAAAFYASLLRFIGCSVAIPETVGLTLGDVHGYQCALGLADVTWSTSFETSGAPAADVAAMLTDVYGAGLAALRGSV
jgi:hypothetical protein